MTQASPLTWPQGWPRTPAHQRRSRYQLKATFDKARRQLYDDIRKLGAETCVISCNLALRVDGQHRADHAESLIDDPGVAVYFQLDGRPMVMASDRYEIVAANLRSVGLAIEYLRGLERHGGGYMMQKAFGGFAQLPPPSGGTAQEPIDWRKEFAPLPDGLDRPDLLVIIESRYRTKARETHTDAGGSNEGMIRINAAIAAARSELGQ